MATQRFLVQTEANAHDEPRIIITLCDYDTHRARITTALLDLDVETAVALTQALTGELEAYLA